LVVAAAAGGGGYLALLHYYSGPSNLESPWTFVLLSAPIAGVAFVMIEVCGRCSERRVEESAPR
jgi:hypothetical protein